MKTKEDETLKALLGYITDKGLLVTCCGNTDYLIYNFDRDEFRVYNETFKLDRILEVVVKTSGSIFIELED